MRNDEGEVVRDRVVMIGGDSPGCATAEPWHCEDTIEYAPVIGP